MNNNETLTSSSSRKPHRGLTGGFVLIAMGLVFLGHGFGWPVPENWWAIFILIPAGPALSRAVALLTKGQPLPALRSLGSCAMLLLVGCAFLLNVDLSQIWPVFLIFAGLLMLLPRREHEAI